MSNLYYTNPLHAAIMVQDFGVNLHTGGGDEWLIRFTALGSLQVIIEKTCGFQDKLYVHPDSADIFKPMVGDLITAQYKLDCGHGDFKYEELVERLPFLDRLQHLESIEIILRDNKAFFTPISED